ncbi:YbaK/EbsC family protein [Thalassospira sp.]|uniref:YbaK/EbsC family protein n=1 Tax=Thalassospira sp. TaxID=1912094 RepID=UPI0027354FCE|nr:YbaK/EbsC family protein [Thalassospira sp.]MDP2696629.1 YbaK/EbsC family protein [Thalassospira sp.]
MKKITPPERLAALFAVHDMDIDVLEFPDGTRSALDAARAVGCDVSDIGKSLIFMTADDNKPVLVIMNGADRVDENRVATLIHQPIRKANADDVRTATGYAIGGVPPFGHLTPVMTLIDEKLLIKDIIWLAAGTPRSVFAMTPDQLRKITGIETGVAVSV